MFSFAHFMRLLFLLVLRSLHQIPVFVLPFLGPVHAYMRSALQDNTHNTKAPLVLPPLPPPQSSLTIVTILDCFLLFVSYMISPHYFPRPCLFIFASAYLVLLCARAPTSYHTHKNSSTPIFTHMRPSTP